MPKIIPKIGKFYKFKPGYSESNIWEIIEGPNFNGEWKIRNFLNSRISMGVVVVDNFDEVRWELIKSPAILKQIEELLK